MVHKLCVALGQIRADIAVLRAPLSPVESQQALADLREGLSAHTCEVLSPTVLAAVDHACAHLEVGKSDETTHNCPTTDPRDSPT
jgi:hypothetical protein